MTLKIRILAPFSKLKTQRGPTSESLELMESIIQRLQPTDEA